MAYFVKVSVVMDSTIFCCYMRLSLAQINLHESEYLAIILVLGVAKEAFSCVLIFLVLAFDAEFGLFFDVLELFQPVV